MRSPVVTPGAHQSSQANQYSQANPYSQSGMPVGTNFYTRYATAQPPSIPAPMQPTQGAGMYSPSLNNPGGMCQQVAHNTSMSPPHNGPFAGNPHYGVSPAQMPPPQGALGHPLPRSMPSTPTQAAGTMPLLPSGYQSSDNNDFSLARGVQSVQANMHPHSTGMDTGGSNDVPFSEAEIEELLAGLPAHDGSNSQGNMAYNTSDQNLVDQLPLAAPVPRAKSSLPRNYDQMGHSFNNVAELTPQQSDAQDFTRADTSPKKRAQPASSPQASPTKRQRLSLDGDDGFPNLPAVNNYPVYGDAYTTTPSLPQQSITDSGVGSAADTPASNLYTRETVVAPRGNMPNSNQFFKSSQESQNVQHAQNIASVTIPNDMATADTDDVFGLGDTNNVVDGTWDDFDFTQGLDDDYSVFP
jgi:hypothetical protein